MLEQLGPDYQRLWSYCCKTGEKKKIVDRVKQFYFVISLHVCFILLVRPDHASCSSKLPPACFMSSLTLFTAEIIAFRIHKELFRRRAAASTQEFIPYLRYLLAN
jgi:hypothetical protein